MILQYLITDLSSDTSRQRYVIRFSPSHCCTCCRWRITKREKKKIWSGVHFDGHNITLNDEPLHMITYVSIWLFRYSPISKFFCEICNRMLNENQIWWWKKNNEPNKNCFWKVKWKENWKRQIKRNQREHPAHNSFNRLVLYFLLEF